MDALPVAATDEMMLQLRRGRPYVSLDTDSVGGYVIRAAAPIVRHRHGPRGTDRAISRAAAVEPARRYGAALPVLLRASGANQAAAQIDLCIDLEFFVLMSLIAACTAPSSLRSVWYSRAGPDRRHARGGKGQLRHPVCRCRDAMSWVFSLTSFND